MTKREPSKEEIFDRLDSGFDLFDAEFPKGLKKLVAIQDIKENLEKERITRKYGTEHPRLIKINDRLRYNSTLKKELDDEIEVVSKAKPTFDAETWRIHGHVLTKEGSGKEKHTIRLNDESGKPVKESDPTDKRGYFILECKVEAGAFADIRENQQLILTVIDSDNRIVHRETEPLVVKPGQIDYRLIILDGDEKSPVQPKPDREDTAEKPLLERIGGFMHKLTKWRIFR